MVTSGEESVFRNPRHTCDLIMKGGVTSGVVYPPAVVYLADSSKEHGGYRFASIGGTSAGAVAAAFTAAAEFNREGGGFVTLRAVSEDLAKTESDGKPTRLRTLFQATPETRPLLNLVLKAPAYFDELVSIGRQPSLRSLAARLRKYASLAGKVLGESEVPGFWRGRRWGLGAGLAFALFVSLAGALWLGTDFGWRFWSLLVLLAIVFGIAGGWLGALAGGVAGLASIVVTDVPKNLFGICSGMRGKESKEQGATEWIHESIQKIAGLDDRVLTFGDLEEERKKSNKEMIRLKLLTTNVSENRPYVLPFDDPFAYRVEDIRSLFPEQVVEHLKVHERIVAGVKLPEGFRFLPERQNLPVAVAARLSMSFPLFFSSIPLYALPKEALKPRAQDASQGNTEQQKSAASQYCPGMEDLIPQWFSDGGIVSNFPIHFFDEWLPEWPTFGLTLRYLPAYAVGPDSNKSAEEKRAMKNYLDSIERWERTDTQRFLRPAVDGLIESTKAARWHGERAMLAAEKKTPPIVLLPRADQIVSPEWQHIYYHDLPNQPISAVPNFLWAILSTMQNYHDDAHGALASYRERVAQLRLQPGQGGFNLDMNKGQVEGLAQTGEKAGLTLGTEFQLEHHQWMRLRVLVDQLNDVFHKCRKDRVDETYEDLIRKQKESSKPFPSGDQRPTWCDEFALRLRELRATMDSWIRKEENVHFDTGRPPPELRVNPKM